MLPGVSKTAILTLRARADEHARADRVFEDPVAAEWFSKVEWPPELDAWYDRRAQTALALRAGDIDRILTRYAEGAPPLTFVELGCGLSTRKERLEDLPIERWIDLDLEPVVALRRSWGADGEHIASSVLDTAWMDRLDGTDPALTVFVAEGLLYYLPRAEVDALFAELSRRFPDAVILLDVLGANDYATCLANTAAVGTPVVWKLEGDFSDVLADLRLGEVTGFEPDRLMKDMLERYWDRIDVKLRGAIYWAQGSGVAWRGRSGMVLGRLDPAVTDPSVSR